MMMEGNGLETVKLSVLRSTGSIVMGLIFIYPLSAIFSAFYDIITVYFGLILLRIAILMVKSETRSVIEGQGPLVRLKYKALAALLFLSCSLLGQFTWDHEDLFTSPLSLISPVAVAPALRPLRRLVLDTEHLLGSPGELAKAVGDRVHPACQIPGQVHLLRKPWRISHRLASRGLTIGDHGGYQIWGAVLREGISCIYLRSEHCQCHLLLDALYTVGKPRSWGAAAIKAMNLDQGDLLRMRIIVIAVAAVSYISALACARVLGEIMHRLNYRAICILVLAFLAAMALAFTGFIGLFAFILSTILGLVAPLTGIKKIHAMEVLMMPLIIYYFSW